MSEDEIRENITKPVVMNPDDQPSAPVEKDTDTTDSPSEEVAEDAATEDGGEAPVEEAPAPTEETTGEAV